MLYNTSQYFYLTVTEPLDICKYFLHNNGRVFLVIMMSSTSKLSTLHFGSRRGKDDIPTPKWQKPQKRSEIKFVRFTTGDL